MKLREKFELDPSSVDLLRVSKQALAEEKVKSHYRRRRSLENPPQKTDAN